MANKQIDPIYVETFNLQPSKGDLRRIAIIEAATHCLAEGVLEGKLFERIGKRVKVPRTLIRYYFKSKESLLEASVQYVIGTAQRMTVERLRVSTSPEERLLALVDAAFDWAEQYPEQVRVLLFLFYAAGPRKRACKLNSMVREAGRSRIREIIQKGFNIPADELDDIALSVQVELSGYVHESVTTNVGSLRKQARASCIRKLQSYFKE